MFPPKLRLPVVEETGRPLPVDVVLETYPDGKLFRLDEVGRE
jgi:hypothetical protein